MLEQMIIAMAVLLTLFHAELTESCSFYKAEIKMVDENATAFLACPALTEHKQLFISLYKGDTKLHSTNLSDMDSNQTSQRFQVHVQNSSISYKILRTETRDTGLYNCTIEHKTDKEKTQQTILLIKDALEPIESTDTCVVDQLLPYAAGCCGVIIAYDLFITVFIYYLRQKLMKSEPPENPYINTRPRGFHRR